MYQTKPLEPIHTLGEWQTLHRQALSHLPRVAPANLGNLGYTENLRIGKHKNNRRNHSKKGRVTRAMKLGLWRYNCTITNEAKHKAFMDSCFFVEPTTPPIP